MHLESSQDLPPCLAQRRQDTTVRRISHLQSDAIESRFELCNKSEESQHSGFLVHVKVCLNMTLHFIALGQVESVSSSRWKSSWLEEQAQDKFGYYLLLHLYVHSDFSSICIASTPPLFLEVLFKKISFLAPNHDSFEKQLRAQPNFLSLENSVENQEGKCALKVTFQMEAFSSFHLAPREYIPNQLIMPHSWPCLSTSPLVEAVRAFSSLPPK